MKREKFLIVKITSGIEEIPEVEALLSRKIEYKAKSISLSLAEQLLEDAGYEVGWSYKKGVGALWATVFVASTPDGVKPLGTYSYLWNCRKKEPEAPPPVLPSQQEAWDSVIKAFDNAIEAATEHSKLHGTCCVVPSNYELKEAMNKELSACRKQLAQARDDFVKAMRILKPDKED